MLNRKDKMSTPEEDALLMIKAFTDSIEVGIKHYHPKTGALLTTVKEIIETLLVEGNINIDFGRSILKIYYNPNNINNQLGIKKLIEIIRLTIPIDRCSSFHTK